jgi:hypothetical protein
MHNIQGWNMQSALVSMNKRSPRQFLKNSLKATLVTGVAGLGLGIGCKGKEPSQHEQSVR